MAKMKVHELSKEIDIPSKEILTFLQEKGIEAKAAQSSIEDSAVDMVKKHFGKTSAPAEPEKTPAAPKAETVAPQDNSQAPKKKKIIIVGGPQGRPQGNSQGGQNRPQNNANSQRPQGNGQRPQNNANSGRPQNSGQRTISGNSYAQPQLIRVRPEALNRIHDTQKEVKEEQTEVKTPAVTPAVNTTPETVAAPKEETAPKKEYLKDIQNNGRMERRERPNDGNQERKDSQRPFNKDGQNRDGQRSFNRDGQNRDGQRPFNRDGQNRDGQRPFNRDGQNRDGQRPFNKDGQNRDGQRPFNKDGQRPGQGGQRQGQGGGSRISFAGPGAGPAGLTKPGSDRSDRFNKNKNYDNNKDQEKKQSDKRKNQERDSRKNRDFMMDDEETLEMKRRKGKFIKPEKKEEVVEEIKVISLEETVTIKDLADKMKIQPAQIVKKLFLEGKIVNVNTELTFEEAENIAIEYDIMCEKEIPVDVIEELLKEDEESEDNMVSRPPVVCVMGHVDHGKTSLLDAIRKTNVTDREAGGITQAIGAYTVNIKDRDITFLDTPGHEAFTEMRMRGANSTDIAVLVVAADDGVMPQTVEAINHAKAAGVEVIVAVNKCDKPEANPDKVKQELTEYELIPTDWGGSTEFVNISAKKGTGIDDLLETILLTADIMELKADPDRKARGLVIEAQLDKGRGPVATVLVQKGTLKVGDFISAGVAHGKVRAMINDKGKQVKVAGPSIPVEILGLNAVPQAGDVFIAHVDDKTAKSYADTFIAQNKEKKLEEIKAKMSLDDLFSKIQEGNLKELNVIVKADVQGSVEAIKQSLAKLTNEEVVVKCIHGGVGAINESDVTLASASNAIIIGFNVRPDNVAKATAEREGVDLRLYSVIYQIMDDVQAAMKGMLDPVYEEKIIGHAEIRQIFKASQIGNIAGSYVLDGIFQRGCKVRITRQGEQVFEGDLSSLKRFKDDVKEVKAGFECGLVFDNFGSFEELDIVEAYIMVEVPR